MEHDLFEQLFDLMNCSDKFRALQCATCIYYGACTTNTRLAPELKDTCLCYVMKDYYKNLVFSLEKR